MDKTEKTQLFNEFIIDHMESAVKLAHFYVKNVQDAEDVVSESVEKAMRRIHTFKEDKPMKPWFYTIVINTAIDHLKRRSKTILMQSVPIYHFDDISLIDFKCLLDMLPADDRQIIVLRFVENHKLNEIAEILGMNENTVKTRLYRALEKLRLELVDDGDGVKLRKDESVAKTLLLGFAGLLITATCVFNLSPTIAAAAYDIPVLGDVVRVITFNRFDYKDNGYAAEIIVPEIQGLLDTELQDRLNAEFRDNADTLIRAFEQAVIDAKADQGDDTLVFLSVKSDYAVRTDNESVLSLDTYIYSDEGNYVLHKFYNLDKRTGKLIALSDLFKPGADYITPISLYLIDEMLRLNKEEDAEFEVGDSMFAAFNEIKPDQNFYISNDGGVVICFDKYEVAAGFMGSPEFIIPRDVMRDIIKSDLIQ